jgi:hypothetical protein
MIQLKKLKKVINADGGDQQASQGVGHRMEGLHPLDKEDIDQRQPRVNPENIKDDPFCNLPIDDPVKDEKIKAKLKAGEKIIKQRGSTTMSIKVIGNTDHDAGDQEKKREQFKVNIGAGLQEYEQAC